LLKLANLAKQFFDFFHPSKIKTVIRKTIRVFIIIYLILLPLSVVAAYFMREQKLEHDGHALSLPLFALAFAGITLLYELLFFVIFLCIWSLFDLMRSEFTHTHNKILWFVLIILLPVLGMIFYLIISPKQKIQVSDDSSR
jgi:hypothetical protein